MESKSTSKNVLKRKGETNAGPACKKHRFNLAHTPDKHQSNEISSVPNTIDMKVRLFYLFIFFQLYRNMYSAVNAHYYSIFWHHFFLFSINRNSTAKWY